MTPASVRAHLGVRYGELADPSNRFSTLIDPVDATPTQPAAFPQRPGSLDWLLGPALAELPQCEDAFQLNIWAPAGATGLPVIFYIPGGAFISGAGTVRWYDGARLAREGPCVVVAVNYRLGMLSHAGEIGGGNLGVGDLVQALHWVSRNIARYGGDPEQLTMVGQSAGAFYAFLLSQLEQTRGMIARTVLMSLAFQPPLGTAETAERQHLVEAKLGRPAAEANGEELLDAQQHVSRSYVGKGLGIMPAASDMVPADLFDVQAAAMRLHVNEVLLTHTATEASAFLGQAPEEAIGRPAVAGFIGAHFEDGTDLAAYLGAKHPDSPKAQLIEAMTLHQFESYAAELALAVGEVGKAVTVVRFEHAAGDPRMGSAHGFDVPFLFGNRADWFDAPMLEGTSDEDFETVGSYLRTLVLGFVAVGWADSPVAGSWVQGYALGVDGLRSMELEARFTAKRPVCRVLEG